MEAEGPIVVEFTDLVTKKKFSAGREQGLDTRQLKNGANVFVAPAPTERANLCYKFTSAARVKEFLEGSK